MSCLYACIYEANINDVVFRDKCTNKPIQELDQGLGARNQKDSAMLCHKMPKDNEKIFE